MNKTYPTLYSRDSKSKILQWNIELQNNGGVIDIKISYGEFDGAQTITWERNIKGVNIGKANETTPFEQAISQIESRIKRQKRRGYMTLAEARDQCSDQSEARPQFTVLGKEVREADTLYLQLNKFLPEFRQDLDGNVKPMKAQQYYRSKKNWKAPDGKIYDDRKYYYLHNPHVEKEPKSIITKFPCMGQPKINGVRALLRYDYEKDKAVLTSKEGLEYNIPHILDFAKQCKEIFTVKIAKSTTIQKRSEEIELIFDGELYIHGEKLQDISSAVKSVDLNTSRVIFIVFDLAIHNKTMQERWDILKLIKGEFIKRNLNSPLEIVDAVQIKSDKQAQAYTDYCIKKGYEGTIFRQLDGVYAFGKRPQSMTKLKRVIDDEFIITNIIPQPKDNTMGMFVCNNKNGKPFKVNPKGTEDYKREVMANPNNFIGKKLTCVFYEYTADDIPYHVIDNIVRDYE